VGQGVELGKDGNLGTGSVEGKKKNLTLHHLHLLTNS
jgi:hypothetical protein